MCGPLVPWLCSAAGGLQRKKLEAHVAQDTCANVCSPELSEGVTAMGLIITIGYFNARNKGRMVIHRGEKRQPNS